MAMSDPSKSLTLEPPEDMTVRDSVSEPEAQVPPSFELEETMQRKMAQHEAFQVYQAHLKQVEHQFQEVLQESKQMVHDVASGRPRGLRTAQKVVDNLLDLLDGSDNSRALLNLIGSNEPNDEFFSMRPTSAPYR